MRHALLVLAQICTHKFPTVWCRSNTINKFMDLFNDPEKSNELLETMFATPIFQESLCVASKDLSKASERSSIAVSKKASNQIYASLIKYFIRMSTK